MSNPRLIYALIALICVGVLGFGIYLQVVKGLEPCPLCIMQRGAFVLVGLVALVAAIHGPRGSGVGPLRPLRSKTSVPGRRPTTHGWCWT